MSLAGRMCDHCAVSGPRWKSVVGVVTGLVFGGLTMFPALETGSGADRVQGIVLGTVRDGKSLRLKVEVTEPNLHPGEYEVSTFVYPPATGSEVTLLLDPMPYGPPLASLGGWRGVWFLPLLCGLLIVVSVVRLLVPGRK